MKYIIVGYGVHSPEIVPKEVEDLLKNLCGLWNMYRLKGKEFFSSNTII